MADKWSAFKGKAKQIEDRDIGRIAAMIGCGEDEMHAFMDVEARGQGFDRQGRPIILYEPHIAYRNAHGTVRDKLVKAGLAYPKWKKGYPADSYPRLKAALAIDETVALKSCSWGFGQILGENHSMAGYSTVQAMVKAMMDDEENHLLAMVNFTKAAGIDDDLRRLAALKRPTTPADCVAIVRVYNGPGYAANNYHTKFAAAHNKWRKIKDTDWRSSERTSYLGLPVLDDAHQDNPADEAAADLPIPDVDYSDGEYYEALFNAQKRLDALGYPEVGTIDGTWGRKTQTAVLAFRAENGLPIVPKIDEQFLAALMLAQPREIDTQRRTMTVTELRAEGAEEIKVADQTQGVGTALAGAGGIGAATTVIQSLDSYSGVAQSFTSAIAPIQDFIRDYMWLLLLAAGIFVVYKSGVLKNLRVFKHRTGKDVSL